jgi:phage tail tube protein FII
MAGGQNATMHLDIGVDDLEEAVAWALQAGATLAANQPQEHVRVMLDPDGHPFCLC